MPSPPCSTRRSRSPQLEDRRPVGACHPTPGSPMRSGLPWAPPEGMYGQRKMTAYLRRQGYQVAACTVDR